LNPWRLSLLFAISGYASSALFRRDRARGKFLRSRLARLGIPLLFGIAVVVTPQPWIALVTHRDYPHGYAHFMLHDYFTFRAIDGVLVPTWMHLWFVLYLLVYTLVLTLLLYLPARVRTVLGNLAERILASPLLLPAPIAYIVIARHFPPGWNEYHDLIHDGGSNLCYFAMFGFGWLLRGSEKLRLAIARQWPIAAGLALCAFGFVAAMEFTYPGDTPLPGGDVLPFAVARGTQCWGAIIALFGIADRYWNHDARWRSMLVEAVFPFYIIHQTIILIMGFWVVETDLPAWLQFALIVGATAAGCWVFYRAGREIGPLRPLIGLSRHPKVRAV
jgi:glucan biosynthesis protein C